MKILVHRRFRGRLAAAAAVCLVAVAAGPVGLRAADSPTRAGTRSTAREFTDSSPGIPDRGTSSTAILPPYVVPSTPPERSDLDPIIRWERERMVQEWMDQPPELQVIYFPPAPPVLGAPLPRPGLYEDEIARQLATYVTEPFYAPLSTRLVEEDLGRGARERLEDYRARRERAIAELRACLDAVRGAERDERRAALRELAARQDPVLEELEETADDLRREFFRIRFFGGGGDWNQFRAWRLRPEDMRSDDAAAQLPVLRVLRAAVFYQEGLSLAQRRLLRERVMTLADRLGVPGAGIAPETQPGDDVIYFSPETARVPLPADLPPAVRGLVADYTATKEALKDELQERLVALDEERNTTRRIRALRDLAGQQDARLQWLEEQAEQIREALAGLPRASAFPAQPPLSGPLADRVSAYLREKSELHRVAQERLAAALAAFDGREQRGSSRVIADRRASLVRSTIEAFHAEHAEEIAKLESEAEAIRSELARDAAARGGHAAAKSIDALVEDFARAFRHEQLASRYAEYRTAVLEPGLSPAQRRLLFGAAIADMKLPGAIRDRQVPADETLPRP